MSHTAKLEIERAQQGIAELRQCIDALEALPAGLTMLFFAGDRDTKVDAAAERIRAALNRYLDANEARRFAAATSFAALDFGGVTAMDRRLDLKRKKMELALANAQDILEIAVQALEKRIEVLKTAKPLRFAPEPPASARPQAQQQPPKRPMFIMKPNIWGVGVDLEEVWRRLKEKEKKR